MKILFLLFFVSLQGFAYIPPASFTFHKIEKNYNSAPSENASYVVLSSVGDKNLFTEVSKKGLNVWLKPAKESAPELIYQRLWKKLSEETENILAPLLFRSGFSDKYAPQWAVNQARLEHEGPELFWVYSGVRGEKLFVEKDKFIVSKFVFQGQESIVMKMLKKNNHFMYPDSIEFRKEDSVLFVEKTIDVQGSRKPVEGKILTESEAEDRMDDNLEKFLKYVR